MLVGKEVIDEDNDRFRYNPENKTFELFYKNSYWIFWCKGPSFDCFEQEGEFQLATATKVQPKFGVQLGNGVSTGTGANAPWAGRDANGSPVEA